MATGNTPFQWHMKPHCRCREFVSPIIAPENRQKTKQRFMAAILADAMNAGAERMAQSSRDVTIHRMMVMVERHLRAAIYASTTSARYRYAQRPLTFT